MNIEYIFLNTGLIAICADASVSVIYKAAKAAAVHKNDSSRNNVEFSSFEKITLIVTLVSAALLAAAIIVRGISSGHGPFTNMYEFSISFSWGIMLSGLIFSYRNRLLAVNISTMILSALMLFYARSLSSDISPLVPALQNSFLLSAHVFSAVIAYGTFAVGFTVSVLSLFNRGKIKLLLPDAARLEKIAYKSVIVGFPFMTLVIVLGALWADIAWGRFWNWDPKETASLVTWLIYALYLHTRVIRKWKGTKSSLLIIFGFSAVIFTFFGNYIFKGLHSYL